MPSANSTQPVTRRSLLNAALRVAAFEAFQPLRLLAQSGSGTSEFLPAKTSLPDLSLHRPKPAVAAPPNSLSTTPDIFGNHWALTTSGAANDTRLFVLAAGKSDEWVPDTFSSLPSASWHSIAADEFGFLWAAANDRLMRLDPHTPDAGWLGLDDLPELKGQGIAALGVAPSGAILVALKSGRILEVGREATTSVKTMQGPPLPSLIGSDDDGTIWLRAQGRLYRRPPEADAWQRTWQLVSRLPAGNHDLSGDLLPGGDFIMAGGQSAGFSYPAVRHAFDQIFALDHRTLQWRTVGRLSHPRFYNGTSSLDGHVWVIGGNRRDEAGEAHFLDTVEICDPTTNTVKPGPRLPAPIEMPIALQTGGRIYVGGGVDPGLTTGSKPHTYDLPGRLWSISSGESAWREEPAGPTGMGPLAGVAHEGKLYLVLASSGIAIYDAAVRAWRHPLMLRPVSANGQPLSPRSPQVAFFEDELWVMGGRDVPGDGIFLYHPVRGTWRSGPKLPRALAWGTAANVAGRLMITGGASGRSYNDRTFILRQRSL